MLPGIKQKKVSYIFNVDQRYKIMETCRRFIQIYNHVIHSTYIHNCSSKIDAEKQSRKLVRIAYEISMLFRYSINLIYQLAYSRQACQVGLVLTVNVILYRPVINGWKSIEVQQNCSYKFLIGFDISDIYVFQKQVCQNRTMENHLNLHMFRIGVICSKGQFDRRKKYQDIGVIHVIDDPK